MAEHQNLSVRTGIYERDNQRKLEEERHQRLWQQSSITAAAAAAAARKRKIRRRRRRRRRQIVCSERLMDGLRSFVAFLFSNVGIVCLVVGYTIAGAFIFVAIEGSHEQDTNKRNNIPMIRNSTATTLWNLTSKANIFSRDNWSAKVENVLKDYQEKIVFAVKKDDYDGDDDRKVNKKWGFAGAFLYSLTVITTIGYGNTCPKTIWGKIVTIVYAMFGMPLFLLYLSNIGDILARSFKWTYARCCLCRCRHRSGKMVDYLGNSTNGHDSITIRLHSPINKNAWQIVTLNQSAEHEQYEAEAEVEAEEENEEEEAEEETDDAIYYDPQNITVPLTLCLAIMVGYICGGAKLFSEWEDWNFLDGSYFCFVSLSTIGFGDIVPGDKIYTGQGLALSSVFCSMYLMLGMALIAMCFNLMQEEVVSKIRTLTRSVRHILSCDAR